MKKIIALQFLFLFHFACAGTGGANDIEVVYLVIIGVLAVPLTVYIMIRLIRKLLKKRKDKMTVSENETNSAADLPES
jgi:hypothetical protein